jgi:hypothetical protein
VRGQLHEIAKRRRQQQEHDLRTFGNIFQKVSAEEDAERARRLRQARQHALATTASATAVAGNGRAADGSAATSEPK